jgi:hypothetical protein
LHEGLYCAPQQRLAAHDTVEKVPCGAHAFFKGGLCAGRR